MENKMILAGLLNLKPLLAFSDDIELKNAFMKNGAAGRAYGLTLKEIASSISHHPGFYVWGHYSESGEWVSVYAGKASKGKISSLRYRISDELREERPFLWLRKHSEEAIRADYLQIWGDTERNIARSNRHLDRSFRKAGAEYIAWAACPQLEDKDIRGLEAFVISKFAPNANIQRPDGILETPVFGLNVVAALQQTINTGRC